MSPTWRSTPATCAPTEVDALRGDASRARAELGWKPEVGFEELVGIMVGRTCDQLAATTAGEASGSVDAQRP